MILAPWQIEMAGPPSDSFAERNLWSILILILLSNTIKYLILILAFILLLWILTLQAQIELVYPLSLSFVEINSRSSHDLLISYLMRVMFLKYYLLICFSQRTPFRRDPREAIHIGEELIESNLFRPEPWYPAYALFNVLSWSTCCFPPGGKTSQLQFVQISKFLLPT